jgi:hypothetical protein
MRAARELVEAAQDLRQIRWADLAGSTRAVAEGGQARGAGCRLVVAHGGAD